MKNYLRERRKELGYTMRQAAEIVGMPPCTLSFWENGNTNKVKADSWAYVVGLANLYKTDTDRITTAISDNYMNRDVIQNRCKKKEESKMESKESVEETPVITNNVKSYVMVSPKGRYISSVNLSQDQLSAIQWFLNIVGSDPYQFLSTEDISKTAENVVLY